MRYNYYYLCLYVLFLLGLVTSCSNDIDYTYKGSNYIQISTAVRHFYAIFALSFMSENPFDSNCRTAWSSESVVT